MAKLNYACVEYCNGHIVVGIVTGGNEHGVYVQEPNKHPVFCNFSSVKQIVFNAEVKETINSD